MTDSENDKNESSDSDEQEGSSSNDCSDHD
jgi:hypothetical protein